MQNPILYQPWGGLGDNLQFSTLPELYYNIGIDFYISEQNVYRNSEIKQLVWDVNPYVKGFSSNPYNIGSVNSYNRKYPNKSIVYNIEALHGFEPKNSIPKIYYVPKNIEELKDKIVLDISCVSNVPPSHFDMNNIINKNMRDKKIVQVLFKNEISNSLKINNTFYYDETIKVNSIFEYCDIIHSCFYFICYFSGQSVLASALNKKNTICITQNYQIGSDYCFPNINYISI